jgi:hypothetical protein
MNILDVGLLVLRPEKIFVWKSGFWGGHGGHYNLMLLVMNLVTLVTGGGRLVVPAPRVGG